MIRGTEAEKKDEKQMMLNKQKKDVEGAKWETKCDRTPNVKCRGGGTCPSDCSLF